MNRRIGMTLNWDACHVERRPFCFPVRGCACARWEKKIEVKKKKYKKKKKKKKERKNEEERMNKRVNSYER